MFPIGYDLNWVPKPSVIKYPEITGYIKDFDGDKYLIIINKKKYLVIKNKNICEKRLKSLIKEKMMDIILFWVICT